MVERELRVALLRRKAHSQWMSAAWTAGGITLFFLLILGLSASPTTGRTLFRFLFILGCLGVITRGFGLTADLFSEERRNGTLGLLVLTGLTPLEIFAHKLFGALLLSSYALLGGLPFIAIPFLAGGITGTQFVCALVFLANALLFCIAVGLLASVVHREGGQAQITALVLGGTLSIAGPLIRWLGPTAGTGMLTTSPVYAGYLVFNGFARTPVQDFWSCSGFTVVYSLTALLLAAVILQRTWREGISSLVPTEWVERWRGKFRAWSTAGRGMRLRERLLRDNPFSWLVARERGPVLAAQACLVTAILLCGALWLASRWQWSSFPNAWLTVLLIHAGFNWVLAYAAAKRFGEERQSGGFELLLTTPLRNRDLVDGQAKGLIAQFKMVFLAIILVDVVLAAGGFFRGGWNPAAVAGYVIFWVVMLLLLFGVHIETASRAMWIGAWTGRPGYAAIQAMRSNLWVAVWLWFISRGAYRGVPGTGGVSSFFTFFLLFWVIGVFKNRGIVREKLTRELRDIASAPIPARGDKRFKSWNPQRIFPPGKWGYWELHPATTRPYPYKPQTR